MSIKLINYISIKFEINEQGNDNTSGYMISVHVTLGTDDAG